MSLQVWLDDERPAPDGYVTCRWPEQVIELIKAGLVERVDLDFYLGEGREYVKPRTGMDVLVWLQTWVEEGHRPPRVDIHTRSPEARVQMAEAAQRIRATWRAKSKAGTPD